VASTERDQELARRRAERQTARDTAAGQRRRMRNAVLASVAAVALVAGAAVAGSTVVSGRDVAPDGPSNTVAAVATTTTPGPSASAVPEDSASVAAADGPGCAYEKTAEPAARPVAAPPTVGIETEKVYAVTVATDRGDIVFELDSARTPCTAMSLRWLAHFGYFDRTACHRLTTKGIQVLQCGDPKGTGSGGPGYRFADENLDGATYPRGTVAMANAGPGTNGSQFFLVYGDSMLPPDYTPFGTITSGLEVLDAVAKAGSDDSNGTGDGRPTLPITIRTLRAAPVG